MQRRNFLKNIGLAGAAIGMAPVVTEAMPSFSGAKDLSNIRLKGKVHNNGIGLANVAVTDGVNVTYTDKNGRYDLLSNKSVEFVYISIPAGYAFANDSGIAKFYSRIDSKAGSFAVDFSLDKLTVDDSKHNFVVWADTQMISKDDVQLLMTQSVPDLQKLVAGYPAGTLFHGIGCGDLVWDKFELFEDYKKAVHDSGVPFFNVLGNHDMDVDSRTDDLSAKTFKEQFGPTYYSFNRGKVHYVVLENVFFIGMGKRYIGYITEQQLQWLEQDLSRLEPGAAVVVSMHIPSATGLAKRMKTNEELGTIVSNREQLYKILAPFKTHIMSGHMHINDNWEKENIMEHNHGAVCGAWWTGPVCSDGTPCGYGVYEVNGSNINWYYKSAGYDKTHQMALFAKGSNKDFPGEIMANVWNWDSKWKVEWKEDGKEMGTMIQRVALDPLAVELYNGPQLPAKHTFVDPTPAEHMFFAKPSFGAKEVEVKATDRFGNVYLEKIAV